ncbi:bifunctional methylenetetrahydrofolate dehydrogenase/methenyltetrahydrofolate cyclohydrolase, partial [Porticoccaceae bacterium]|nr:bifunctional methylenetetrahydrofolate dehydrogenase/methenyltetrahydrofolate cyclohydrolase [Porticoccaceae bacterium]
MNIDGKALAQELRDNLKTEVKQLQDDRGITPGLTVVLVGEDPASQIYVRNKVRQTEEVGMISNEIRMSAETSQQVLLD